MLFLCRLFNRTREEGEGKLLFADEEDLEVVVTSMKNGSETNGNLLLIIIYYLYVLPCNNYI